jgi:hypothetical protein
MEGRPFTTLVFTLLACRLMAAGDVQPYALQMVDEASGRGIPGVLASTANGLNFVSDSNGWIVVNEVGLMKQRVHLSIRSPGYAFPKDNFGIAGLAFDMMPGATIEVKLVRSNIAERMYRLTGQGIYRDSTILGQDVPLPYPNTMNGLLRLQYPQVTTYQGKLFWLWSEASQTVHPLPITRGVAATSDLPDTTGLDPTQGVHFNFWIDSTNLPMAMLPDTEVGLVQFDGLLSTADIMGAEHLVAHYRLLDSQGQCVEQGVAEFMADVRRFERISVLSADYPWQFPQGQAVRAKTDDGEHFYFATPHCTVRVPCSYESIITPGSYQALTWTEAMGKVGWQSVAPPMSRSDENRWRSKGVINDDESRLTPVDSALGTSLTLTSGSVSWNEFRKAWITIAGQSDGSVWYLEAGSISGPWQKAVQIATHTNAGFESVQMVDGMEQQDQRVIYFMGTYRDAGMPRYDGNQLMYRLDLRDPRLASAHRD